MEKYHVPDAVAGATVLAVGTSFPELIIGFVAQFLSRDADPSITLGVTLGSAIFNQLAIVGACALVAPGGALRVQWRAMLRDVLVWGATIVITAGCLANGKVSALEGWLMVAFYVLYVVICAYWSRIISRFAPPPRVVRNWTYTARHGYFLLFLYFLFNVYVVLDAIPATNVPGPSGI